MILRDLTVIDVLNDRVRYIVPFYQRHYKWEETLWNSFWDDVRAKAEEALTRPPKFDHYMGALILSRDGLKEPAVTPRLFIIDGQQRLMTFQLFLAAMREAGEELKLPEIGEVLHSYLFNDPLRGDVGDDVEFKLAPNRADRETFYKLMRSGLKDIRKEEVDWFYKNGNIRKDRAPNSVRALSFFARNIIEFARTGIAGEAADDEPFSVEDLFTAEPPLESPLVRERLKTLLTAVLSHLKLVTITLEEKDDAQVIFETLNSKSEPLTAMELVRNSIFHRATAEGDAAERLCERKWEPLEQPFWNAMAPRARPTRPRIDHFLSHALTAQTGEEISLRELYAEYRAFARPDGRFRFPKAQEELDSLVQYVPIYRSLEGEITDPDIGWIGDKLGLWEVTTAYPVIFAVAASSIDKKDKRRIYELLNSYLVRRALCGLTSKNLNKNFQRMVAVMLREGVSVETFESIFREQSGDSVRFPTDREVREAVQSQPLYERFHRKERLQEILWDIECASRNRFTVNTPKPEFLSIEHIMPQRWGEHWPLRNVLRVDQSGMELAPEAFDDETREALEKRRNAIIHTLGNLTLVTSPANTGASNSGFDEKKSWFAESLLKLNADLVQRSSWSEEDILARSRDLGDSIVRPALSLRD